MLFGKNRKSSYGLPVLKHIAEIIVSNDPSLYDKLRSVSAEEITSTLKTQNVTCDTPIRQLREYIRHQRPDEDFLSWFDKQLTIAMMTHNDFNLPYEYSKIPYVSKQLRAKLERDIRKYINNKRADYSDGDWSAIMHDFSTNFLEKYSSDYQYDPTTNGIVKFIVNSFNFYMKSKSSYLLSFINTTGVNTELENADYSRADLTTVDVTYTEELPNFSKIATDIYQLSSFLFTHNRSVYYDLFSRYKRRLAETRYDAIDSILKGAFQHSSMYGKPEYPDTNFKVAAGRSSETEKYARDKARVRNIMMSYFDPILENKVGVDDLSRVINDVIAYNNQIYAQTHGKDQMPVLAVGDYVPKDGLDNDTKITYMISAMCALRDLVNYIDKMGINIFKVPSAIFKDKRLLPRFKTFREYMELYSEVESLMQVDKADESKDLMTNDEIYAELMESVKLSSVKGISLVSIKDAIEQYQSKREADKKAKKAGPIIDTARLGGTISVFKRFTGAEKGATLQFPEQVAIMSNVLLPRIKAMMIEAKALRGDLKYDVDPDFKFRETFTKEYGEGIWNTLTVFFNGETEDKLQLLAVLRSMDFITAFLRYVKDVIQWLAAHKDIKSDLKLFLEMSKNADMFTMPKYPKHNDEFEWFQNKYNLQYFLPEGYELQDINGHMIELYNKMYKQFELLFVYLDELYRGVYAPLSRNLGLVEQSPYDVPEAWLQEASFSIYRSGGPRPAVEYTNFKHFLNQTKSDKYGFLMKNGKIVKRMAYGALRYLHEYGYWVWFNNGKPVKMDVSESDTFKD